VSKITKILKRQADPLGIVFKDKKKKVTTNELIKVEKQSGDEEVAARRQETASRLAANRKSSPGLGTTSEDVIRRPAARSAKLFGE
tara:strand:- start:776 stop:1033 length:258 start_codon:yes stop_codon:yes gene_type:complete